MRRLVVFCVVLWGSAAACSRPHAETSSPAPIVAVARVSRGDVAQTLTIAAEFRPYQEIDVHAKVAGYVKSIDVDVGDRVARGQLIATLEVPELQDDLQQDEASVKRAAEEINRAQADLERAQSAHEIAHLGSTRLASVMQTRPNLIAQQDIDEAVSRDRVAEAQVATARAGVASAREQLAVAQATQAKTKTLVGYTRIIAPFDGVITHRYADTGAMIQAGTSSQTQAMPLVKLSQNDRLRVIIPVPESAVPRIRLREPVDVRVQSIGKTFPGVIARVADRLDPDTRTMRVEVDVANRTLELVPGMFAQTSIALDRVSDALTVPVQAIDRADAAARVLVVGADRKIEARDVRVVLESADRVAVTGDLAAGDLVVIGSRAQLKPGTAVSPKVMATAKSEESR